MSRVSRAFQIFSFLGEIQGGGTLKVIEQSGHSLETPGLVQEVRTQAKVSQLAQGQIAKNRRAEARREPGLPSF